MLRGGHGGSVRRGENYELVIPGNERERVSRENRAFLDAGALGPFAGADLWAVGLHARDLEAPVRAHHRDAVGIDRDDLAELAGDALRARGGKRLRVEDLHRLVAELAPRGRRGIAAADQPVDLLPGLAPVDVRIAGTAAALVGRLALILLDARRLAGLHEIDAFEHRVDAHCKEPVE